MTPKEKCDELYGKCYDVIYGSMNTYWKDEAKRLALIAVDEILGCKNEHDGYITCDKNYWRQVKEEIENL